jgi:hypothetical protein
MIAMKMKKIENPALLRKLKRQLLNSCMDVQEDDAELKLNNTNID